MEYFLISDLFVIALLLIIFMRPISALCRKIYELIVKTPETLVPNEKTDKKGK